jgi:hypothetical protein
MVRDMMLGAVEARFSALRAPHVLEWLTASRPKSSIVASAVSVLTRRAPGVQCPNPRAGTARGSQRWLLSP